MNTFRHCFQVTIRLIAAPLIVSVVLVSVCLVLALPDESTTRVDHLAGLWLHLPAFLLSATCLGAALEAWPLYSRGRSGEGLLLRLERGPLSGCGVAALGTLTALGISLAVMGVLFEGLLNSFDLVHQPVHARIGFVADRRVLDDEQAKVTLAATSDLPIKKLDLRPAGHVGGEGIGPARLQIRGDGTALHAGWLEAMGGEMIVDVDPPRFMKEVSVERHPDSRLMLVFGPGSVWGQSDRTFGGLANCLLAILSYLVPTALALAVMALGHRYLALPVGFAAGLATLGLATLVELAPNAAAVRAFARGQWIPAEGLSPAALGCVAGAALVLLLAYPIGKLKRT